MTIQKIQKSGETKNNWFESDHDLISKIAEDIKQTLTGWDEIHIQDQLKKTYILLRLMDENGKWKSQELTGVSDLLMPADMNKKDVYGFIDRIVYLLELNPYFKTFIEKAKGQSFKIISNKAVEEGKKVFPEVVTCALMLDLLTKAFRNDWRVMKSCRDIWTSSESRKNWGKHIKLFERAKIASCDVGVNIAFGIHRKGVVSPKLYKILLPVNILEAIMEDLKNGFFNNARAGWPLAYNRPTRGYKNEKGKPSRFSEDKKIVLFSMPMPLLWTDLYQTWDMAFCSHYPNFPFFLTKLLIPQVMGYQDRPEEYIYIRSLALYIFVHYEMFSREKISLSNEKTMNWHDPELTKLWGEANRESSIRYKETLIL